MSQEGEKLSRREFLKASLTAGAFLAELSLPREVRAQLEKLLKTQEFIPENLESTIARLQREVWNNKNEVLWAYVKKGSWEGAMNIMEITDETSAKSVDLAPLYLDKDVSMVHILHTHPANAYFHYSLFPRGKVLEIIKERKSKFPLPPSGDDIVASALDKQIMKQLGLSREAQHSVVEPTGVWTYDVDLEHPVIKALIGGKGSSDILQRFIDADILMMQDKIYREGGISDKNLADFKNWFKDVWGVALSYQPFQ